MKLQLSQRKNSCEFLNSSSREFPILSDSLKKIQKNFSATKPKFNSFHKKPPSFISFPLKKPDFSLKKQEKSFFESVNSPFFKLNNSKDDNLETKLRILQKAQEKSFRFFEQLPQNEKLIEFFQHLSQILKKIRSEIEEKNQLFSGETTFSEKILDFEITFQRVFLVISQQILDFSQRKSSLKFNETPEKSSKIDEIIEEKSSSLIQNSEILLLRLENQRLRSAFEQLSQKTNSFGFSLKIPEEEKIAFILKSEIDLKNKAFVKKEEDFNQILLSKQQIINNYKNICEKFKGENTILRYSIEKTKENDEKIKKINLELFEEKNRFFELSQMQYEEMIYFSRKTKEITVFSQKLKEKIEVLNEKVLKLAGNRIENPENPEEKNFFKDLALFSITKENLFTKVFKKSKETPLLTLLRADEILRNKEKLFRISNRTSPVLEKEEPDDFSSISLTKPSFFSFIEHKYQSYSSEIHSQRSVRVSPLFLTLIRAIFDSKYNEILMDSSKMTPFPEFVYFFLAEYQISPIYRKLIKITKNDNSNANADDARIIFLIDLTNQKLQKLWEIATFKDFLDEKSQLDELFFYLHSRNLLFKGPQLAYSSASFDIIHYVTINKAFEVIDLLLAGFEKKTLDFVKIRIKEKGGKNTMNGGLVDSAFVLRLLLEFYKGEKTLKISLIHQLFDSQKTFEVANTNTLSISFQSFRKIMENFQVSEIEKAILYRKSWNLGEGAVNSKSFLIAAQEDGFFLRNLKLKTRFQVPIKLDFDKNILEKEGNAELLELFLMNHEKSQQNLKFWEEIADKMGIGSELRGFKEYKRVLLGKLQVGSEEIKENSLIRLILRWMNEILKIAQVVVEFEEFDEKKTLDVKVLKGIFVFLEGLGEIQRNLEEKKKVKNLEMDSKAKKLQEFCKKKVSKWYWLLSSLLGEKAKNNHY